MIDTSQPYAVNFERAAAKEQLYRIESIAWAFAMQRPVPLELLCPQLINEGNQKWRDIPFTDVGPAFEQDYNPRTPVVFHETDKYIRRIKRHIARTAQQTLLIEDMFFYQQEIEKMINQIAEGLSWDYLSNFLTHTNGDAIIAPSRGEEGEARRSLKDDGAFLHVMDPGPNPNAPRTKMTLDDWRVVPTTLGARTGFASSAVTGGTHFCVASLHDLNQLLFILQDLPGGGNVFRDSPYSGLLAGAADGTPLPREVQFTVDRAWQVVPYGERGVVNTENIGQNFVTTINPKTGVAVPAGYRLRPIWFYAQGSVCTWKNTVTAPIIKPLETARIEVITAQASYTHMHGRLNPRLMGVFYKWEEIANPDFTVAPAAPLFISELEGASKSKAPAPSLPGNSPAPGN